MCYNVYEIREGNPPNQKGNPYEDYVWYGWNADCEVCSMKVWIVFLYQDHYPYGIKEYHVFGTEDRWKSFMESYYDKNYKSDYNKGFYEGWNSYEEMRENWIQSNENDYITWEALELE